MKEETLKRRVEKLEARHGRLNQKVDEHKAMYNFVIGNDKYSIANKIELLEREQSQIKHHLGLAETAGDGCVWLNRNKTFEFCRDPQKCCKHNPPTPDLPLHVRVAKALGKPFDCDDAGGFYFTSAADRSESMSKHKSVYIPDYANDLEAAMGALEEYCDGNKCWGEVTYFSGNSDEFKWQCYIVSDENIVSEYKRNNSQAICKAIVAHAKQQ